MSETDVFTKNYISKNTIFADAATLKAKIKALSKSISLCFYLKHQFFRESGKVCGKRSNFLKE